MTRNYLKQCLSRSKSMKQTSKRTLCHEERDSSHRTRITFHIKIFSAKWKCKLQQRSMSYTCMDSIDWKGWLIRMERKKNFGLTLFEVICDQSYFLAKFIIEKSRLNSVNLTMTATELSLNDLLSPQSTTGDYEWPLILKSLSDNESNHAMRRVI